MSLSAQEAAEKVGLSKAAILKSIKAGKVSAQKDINGVWRIEPVELFRVYQPVSDIPRPPQPESTQPSTEGLQRENQLLRETVADLRARLDAESTERQRLTLILTEMQQPPKTKNWLARLLGS